MTMTRMARPDGRKASEMRPVKLTPGFVNNAYASVLVEQGSTRIICAASVENHVPRWMKDSGEGWVTAEYDMLPASTGDRRRRDARKGKLDGRTVEISRLIGRSLRAVVDRTQMGERIITIDCDVIDADGGTRCASITGGYVALHLALQRLVDEGELAALPLVDSVAAVSVGVVDGVPVLDLPYPEDSRADVDMNVVVTGDGNYVELQATGEGSTFTHGEFDTLRGLADAGCAELREIQKTAINGGA